MQDRYLYPLLLVSLLIVLPCGLAIRRPAAPRPKPEAMVDGQVVDERGPVAGAQVRFKGEAAKVYTDAGGAFRLPRPAWAGERVTAWKAGYFIGGAPAGSTPVQIKLRRLPAEDFEDYVWVDPSPDPAGTHNCANCHGEIYREWRASGHARSATGRRFQDLYRDLLREHPGGSAVCQSCHAPTVRFGEPAFADLTQVGGIAAQGVHCDLCHKVQDAGLGHVGWTHGWFGLQFLRPREGQLFFGPLADVDRGDDAFSPLYRQSRYCASCHEGTVFGIHVYGTYTEWLQSPAVREGKQCQDCHMAPTGRMINIAPGKGGIDRDPKTLANHVMFAPSQAEMLRKSLKLVIDTNRLGDGVQARVEVRAEGVGHRLPTGFIDRHLVLMVEGLAGQEVVPAQAGPRLPAAAGKGLAGQAGKLYARLPRNFTAAAPPPFWLVEDEPVDTRLEPETSDLSRYSFPKEAERLRVRLIYRRFWPATAAAKGWPDDAVVVVDRVIPVP